MSGDTCNYCPTPARGATCGSQPCRTKHAAHLMRGIASVHEASAHQVSAAFPGLYRDADEWVEARRASAVDARAKADALDPPRTARQDGSA